MISVVSGAVNGGEPRRGDVTRGNAIQRSLSDAKASEDAVEQMLRRGGTGDLAERGDGVEKRRSDEVDRVAAVESSERIPQRFLRAGHGVRLPRGREVGPREIELQPVPSDRGDSVANGAGRRAVKYGSAQRVVLPVRTRIEARRSDIALVEQDDARAPACPLEHVARVGIERKRAVDDDERDRRRAERGAGAFDAEALDRVVGI